MMITLHLQHVTAQFLAASSFLQFSVYFAIYQLSAKPPDPCKTVGCKAPYNIGCRTVNNTAECICPTCPDTADPVCTSDDIQDRSECHMERQSCISGDMVTVAKKGPCGMVTYFASIKRDKHFAYCYKICSHSSVISHYYYCSDLLRVNYPCHKGPFLTESIACMTLYVNECNFYISRKGMQTNCRYWICHRLIWKHWTKQLGKNEAIPKSVGQQA